MRLTRRIGVFWDRLVNLAGRGIGGLNAVRLAGPRGVLRVPAGPGHATGHLPPLANVLARSQGPTAPGLWLRGALSARPGAGRRAGDRPDALATWPPALARTATQLSVAEEDALPCPDGLFDRVLMVHGLESADSTRLLMRQIWRTLAPAGRLLIVAPNRLSLWAQVDRSPFAQGSPFNRLPLTKL